MQNSSLPLTLKIMDKEYRIVCPAEERESLIKSAEYLDTKMRDIRRTGKVIGGDRVAVVAALNITHELLQQRAKLAENESLKERIYTLTSKVEEALAPSVPSAHESEQAI